VQEPRTTAGTVAMDASNLPEALPTKPCAGRIQIRHENTSGA
jgi:hypothetical protein